MIWLFIALYVVLGFVFMLVGQILSRKVDDSLDYFDLMQSEDPFEFRIMATVTVLFWPGIGIFYIMALLIPWLITFLYKLFVGIIFGTIALFKKEKGKDGVE